MGGHHRERADGAMSNVGWTSVASEGQDNLVKRRKSPVDSKGEGGGPATRAGSRCQTIQSLASAWKLSANDGGRESSVGCRGSEFGSENGEAGAG